MGGVDRANTVCRTCAERKKACDKALPACGFCMKKNVVCRYGLPARRRKYHPGKNFVAISTDSSSTSSPNEGEEGYAQTGLLLDSLIRSSRESIDDRIYLHVRRTLHAANLTVESVGEHYFRIFDRSLPIISCHSFRQVASEFGDAVTPPAACSILVLCMLLVTGPRYATNYDKTTIYRTSKALVSQAQATTGLSLHLLQAASVIAAAEHISGRPEAAYVSLAPCLPMARLLGTHDREVADVCWAIAALERMILCELPQRNLLPLTDLPEIDSRISWTIQQSWDCSGNQRHGDEQGSHMHPASQNIPDGSIQDQAQLLFLLDQTLRLVSSTGNDEPISQADFMSLDKKIRSCLERVIKRCLESEDTTSPSVALAVRLIFLLHGAMVDTLEITPAETAREERVKSMESLDSVCNMVVDIARFYNPDEAGMMPICCCYNLRMAIRHLQSRKERRADISSHVSRLLESEERYRRRWCFD